MTEKSKPAAARRIEVEPIFGDFAELEHVCDLLREQAKVADAPAGHPVHENGPVRLLRERIGCQWRGQANEIEAEHPGLFDRTYLAPIYREADALLALIAGHPAALPGNLARLELLMHKLYILPLRDFEEVQRELKRAAKAVEDARQEGAKSEKDAQSKKASEAVKARGDQVERAAFIDWAKCALDSGKTVDTVSELQGLEGFAPAWSGRGEKTLKAWAKIAGFTFKTGRPKKKK
jgi:hypothetical protein